MCVLLCREGISKATTTSEVLCNRFYLSVLCLCGHWLRKPRVVVSCIIYYILYILVFGEIGARGHRNDDGPRAASASMRGTWCMSPSVRRTAATALAVRVPPVLVFFWQRPSYLIVTYCTIVIATVSSIIYCPMSLHVFIFISLVFVHACSVVPPSRPERKPARWYTVYIHVLFQLLLYLMMRKRKY